MTQEDRDRFEQLRERCQIAKDKLAITLRNTDNFTSEKWQQYKYLEDQIKLINLKLKEQ
jgi:hypothetical protein